MQPRCEICDSNVRAVCSSWLGAVSVALCDDCLIADLQPWWILIATGSTQVEPGNWDTFVPEFRECVLRTAEKLGKTEADFWKDVAAILDKEAEYWSELEEFDDAEKDGRVEPAEQDDSEFSF